MIGSQEAGRFERLVQQIDPQARLLRSWPLTGGVSAQVTAFEIQRADGRTERLVARRHGAVDLRQNPQIARDEFRLLQIAHAHGLAAPKPYYFDEPPTIFATPVIVVAFIDGETLSEPSDLADYITRAASELARIHRVGDSPELAFLPRQGSGFGPRPATLDDSLSEGRIRDALEAAWPLPQLNESTLLHGDYWPGNILWRDGELVGVIDWEDARVGDPLGDLANTRLELLWAFGADAMAGFTAQYRSMTTLDLTNLPYWDLCAALRPCSKLSGWGLDHATESTMRARHTRFVTEAIDGLRGQ